MTIAAFLAWEAEQPDRHEFYRGKVFGKVGGSARHNQVIFNLRARLAVAALFKGVEAARP